MQATTLGRRTTGPLLAVLFAAATAGTSAGSWLPVTPDSTESRGTSKTPQAPSVVVDWYGPSGLELTVDVTGIELTPENTIAGTFVTASLPDAPLAGETGCPALPVVRRLFIAPPGSKINLTIDAGPGTPVDLKALGLDSPITPMQSRIQRLPGDIHQLLYYQNWTAYSADAMLPTRRAVVTELGTVRGNRLCLLEVRPFAYNPTRDMLNVWPHLRLAIEFPGAQGDLDIRDSLPPLRDVLLNPPLRSSPTGRALGNYLIVVADAFSSAITSFASAKQAQGYATTTHSVAPGTPNMDIKAYIDSLWGTLDAPDYVLLVGDVDAIPTWTGGGDQTATTDLPYGCMDGGDDWYPDIPVGRFSVSSVDELNSVTAKTLHVAGGAFSDPDYVARAAFLAGTDVVSGDEATHNWVINNYMEPNGIESHKLYMRTFGATTQDVHIAFNQGCVYGVFYGHSWADQWQSGPPFSHADVQNLVNEGLFPFLFNFTCRIGDFSHATWEPCFLEEWLRVPDKGAAACYGASGFTYYEDNPGWPETSNLEKFLFDTIYLDGVREVGPAWHGALMRLLTAYGPDEPVVRDYFEMFNLLGDPSLRVPAPVSKNYLIIAPEDYADSQPLQQLANARINMGMTAKIITVHQGTSNTDVKSLIQDLWGTPNAPDYILLVGDTDGSVATENTIPHWAGGGSKQADTDLPYGCMDPGDDWYPEIPVGRLSVTSVAQLQDVVDKTLFVEAGNFPDPEYVKRGAFLANPSTYNTAEPTHDWVIDNYLTPNSYEGIKLYASQGADTADVTAAINNGAVLAVYMGHSSSSGWWDPSFYQGDVQALSNEGLYGLVFGWSCNTAHFSYDECVGETWLRVADKGAAAYISASNYIYWGSVEAWEPSAVHEKSFFAALFEDDIWEVGPAWQAGLYRFLTEYGNWDGDPNHPPQQNEDKIRNFFEEFVLLGDPALRLPRPNGFLLFAAPEYLAACCPPDTQVQYTVDVDTLGSFDDFVTLNASDLPPGTIVNFSVNYETPPFTSVMTVDGLGGAGAGDYNITITGSAAGGIERSTEVMLNISTDVPDAVTLSSPPNGDTDVSRTPTLVWESSPDAAMYNVEVATDSAFANVVYQTAVSESNHTVETNLDANTLHYWHVKAVNGCGDSGFSTAFNFITLDMGDYFTEEFADSQDVFDLENFTIQFTPDGSGDYYDVCGWPAASLPTDPTGGTPLTVGDDGYVSIVPSTPVYLYGTPYTSVYVNANGSVTFGSGDQTYNESLTAHFNKPRVAGVFDDLNPETGGTVSSKQLADRAVVTWLDVPEWGTPDPNTFQIEIFFDGRIHITWLEISCADAIVGLSEGNGIPSDFLETDLSEVTSCFVYGACCDGEICSVTTEDQCLGLGGVFLGDGTDCDPNPCGSYESECLIISEVVSGHESGNCPRWIEITNTGFRDFAFLQGGIIVQTDSSNDVDLDVDLAGVTIPAGESFVINSNQLGACTGAFPAIYGFDADFYCETPFGNGDDRYLITDTADGSNILDIYGEFGVDGTGEPWEYTEGYAYRLPPYNSGDGQEFAPGEWFYGGPGSLTGDNPTQLLLDNTTPGVHLSDEPCFTGDRPGDMDGDGDVDEDDFNAFTSCFSGPSVPYDTGCEPGDSDVDGDIDCDDWTNVKIVWTGPPPIPPIFAECDVDCNKNGVADEFDIAGGTSIDCNHNAIPDECDVSQGTSDDANENGIPDECEVCAPPLPEDSMGIACVDDEDCAWEARCISSVCYAPKHRYLSIALNPAQITNTARRLRLNSGEILGWVGVPYENSGTTLADVAPAPVYAGTDFAGEWPEVVQLVGCEIATAQTYVIQAILIGRDIGNEDNYSQPLELHTPSVWGDTVSTCAGNTCFPPNGIVGLDDIMAGIKKYQGVDVAPLTWVDIDPSGGSQKPNQVIGIGDILACIEGFQGKAYPGYGPLSCP